MIGVTVSRRSGWRIFPLMALNVWLAGGRALRWQAGADVDLDAVDGIIVGGGDDISPTLYDGELTVEARLDPDRDALEHGLIEEAHARNMPVFGICRGAQMLNVVFGGTLDQDAYGTFGTVARKTILPRKDITVMADTRLATIAGTDPMRVNALHTQAVDRVGRGLQVAARDEYGMVQAVERKADPFALGVQWHPEHLFYAHRQRRLFHALVDAARAYRTGRGQLRGVDLGLERSA